MIVKKLTVYELDLFIDFQYNLYENDKNFRPELRSELKNYFIRNPFLKIADVSYYIAILNEKTVGRIAKIVLPDNPVMFGFFECINDYSVAKALFDEIDEKKGLLGPINFTTNDSCGLLINGFETPTILMPYNKAYYQNIFEKCGFKKEIDMFAYWFSKKKIPSEIKTKFRDMEEKLKKEKITIRNIDIKKYKEELSRSIIVYNESNRNNWGFMPISLEEAEYIAKRLKKIAKPEYIFIVEKNGEIIGYYLSVPDINEITFKKGRLTLKSIFQFLFFRPRKIKCLILGMKDEYRRLGIASYLLYKLFEAINQKKSIKGFEGSYILENNIAMNGLAHLYNAEIYRTYRVYKR